MYNYFIKFIELFKIQKITKEVSYMNYINYAVRLCNDFDMIFFKNIMNNLLILKLVNQFSLMESMLLLDGFICSIYFLKDFLILKLSFKKLINDTVLDKYKQQILKKYDELYKLSFIDRYILYLFIYTVNIIANKTNNYLPILIFTLPFLQNRILSFYLFDTFINLYIKNKFIFCKYSISKLFVNFIQSLHPQLVKIQNYNIFIIYKILTIEFIFNIIRNGVFILLLNILRSYNSTYYYYKGIKMAYYYNAGYLYSVINLDDAIYLMNVIINEKRWKELEKIEVINGFFTLILNKYKLFTSVSSNFIYNFQIIFIQFLSMWSLVSLLKIISTVSNILVYIVIVSIYTYLRKLNIRNIVVSFLIYLLILFNINDLIITIVILTNSIVYYCLKELLFFTFNINNIKKIIKMYTVQSKESMISRVNEEYIVI